MTDRVTLVWKGTLEPLLWKKYWEGYRYAHLPCAGVSVEFYADASPSWLAEFSTDQGLTHTQAVAKDPQEALDLLFDIATKELEELKGLLTPKGSDGCGTVHNPGPGPKCLAPHPTASSHKELMERLSGATPEELLNTSVKAGVHNPDGTLQDKYRDTEGSHE